MHGCGDTQVGKTLEGDGDVHGIEEAEQEEELFGALSLTVSYLGTLWKLVRNVGSWVHHVNQQVTFPE